MADRNHYIDVVLRLRDEFSGKVRSVTGEMEQFRSVTKEMERDTSEAMDRLDKSFVRSSKSLAQLKKEGVDATGTVAREIHKLDSEAKKFGDTMADNAIRIKKLEDEARRLKEPFDEASKKVEDFNKKFESAGKLTKRQKEQLAGYNHELSVAEAAYKKVSDAIGKEVIEQRKLGIALDEIHQKQRQIQRLYERDERPNQIEREIVKVEQLTDRYVTLQKSATASDQQRANANKELVAATRDLQLSMSKTLSMGDKQAAQDAERVRVNREREQQELAIAAIRQKAEAVSGRIGGSQDIRAIVRMRREVDELEKSLVRLGVRQDALSEMRDEWTGAEMVAAEKIANAEIEKINKESAKRVADFKKQLAKEVADEIAAIEKENAALDEAERKDRERRIAARAEAEAARHVEMLKAESDAAKQAAKDQAKAQEEAARARAKAEAASAKAVSDEIKRINKAAADETARINRETAKRIADFRKQLEKDVAAEIRALEKENAEIAEAERKDRERQVQARAQAEAQRYIDKVEAQASAERAAAKSRQDDQKRAVQLERDLIRAIEDAGKARLRADDPRGRLDSEAQAIVDLDASQARAKALALQAELEALVGDINVNVDVDIGAAVLKLLAFRAAKEAAAEPPKQTGIRGFFQSIGEAGANAARSFQNASSSVSQFDNFLRGLLTLAVTVFLQQIIVLAGAAAFALLALASSALTAASAIGGVLVAGLAQAMPMLGIFAAAVARVGAVMDALKQSQLVQQQQSYAGGKEAKQAADAQDTVRNATDALADAQDRIAEAHRKVADAQKDLTEAREDARRKLEDLILAERGQTLSMQEAQDALRTALSTGDTTSIQRARLRVDETRTQLGRTRQGVQQRQAGGIGGSPEVTGAQERLRAAQKGLEDAEKAAKRAERAVERAKRGADEAASGVTSAQGKLAFLLGEMSEAERSLYAALERLQKRWAAVGRQITDPMIRSFTTVTDKITALLGNRKLVDAAVKLSTRMGKSLERIFNVFTDRKSIGFFVTMMEEARRNVRPFERAIIGLGRAFQGIALAASPALRQVFRLIANLTEKFAEYTNSAKGQKELNNLFQNGVKHLRAWGRLLGAIVDLFIAIAGPGGGAASGLRIIDRLTGALQRMRRSIEANPERMRGFFKTMEEALTAIKPIVAALGREFALTFNEEGIKTLKGLAGFLSKVLIPALGDFIRTTGKIGIELGKLAENDKIAGLMKIVITATLLAGIGGKIFAVFRPLIAVFGVLAAFGGALAGLIVRLGNLGARVASLGPWFRKLAVSISLLGKPFEFVGRMVGRFGSVVTRMGGIIARVAPLIGRAVALMFGPWGLVIAGVITGTYLLVKNFDKVKDAFRSVWNTIKRVVNSILEFLGIKSPSRVFRKIGQAIVDGLTWPFRTLWSKVYQPIFRAFMRAIDWMKTLPGKFKSFGVQIGDAIVEGLKALPGKIKGIFTGTGELIRNVVGSITKFINDKTPFGDVVISVFGKDIRLPKLPERFQKGGPVGGHGSGDIVPALLEPGEHVLTKREVAAAGGHGIIFALRRMLGGGTQGGPRGYALGGAVSGSRGQAGISGSVNLNFGSSIEAMTQFVALWKEMWQQIVRVGNVGIASVTKDMRDMRESIGATMTRLSRTFHERWRRMTSYADKRAEVMVTQVRSSIRNLMTTVYEGMDYIGDTTNAALKSFDADPVRLRLTRPPGVRAATGYIGHPGERGHDKVLALVGRGEAVLNHWQQRAVQSMLPPGASLYDIIKRTRGYHAGGPEQPGFAGGYAGKIPGNGESVPIPGAPGEYIAKRIVGSVAQMMRRYKMAVTDGFAISGHTRNSDHYRGLAVDFVPGAGGNWNLVDQAAAYARTQLGRAFRWIGYDGVAGHGRGHHLHLSWLSDAKGLGAAALATIKKLKIAGLDPLRSLASNSVEKVRKAANALLESQMYDGVMTSHPTGEGVLGRGAVMSVISKAMGLAGVPESLQGRWRAMAYDRARQESGFNPNAQNNWDSNAAAGDPSIGLFQTIGATFRAFMRPGMSNIKNPLHNAVAAFRYMFSRYGGGKDWNQALQRMLGLRGVGYATGGIVPGDYDGAPQPILAHAGEWVVNRTQQAKLAALSGHPVESIRAALGFTGGPSSFSGGGVIRRFATGDPGTRSNPARTLSYSLPDVFPLSPEGVLREIRKLHTALRKLDNGAKNFLGEFTKGLNMMTREGGLLERVRGSVAERFARLQTSRAITTFRRQEGPAGVNISGQRRAITRIIQRRTPERQLELEIKDLAGLGDDLAKIRKTVSDDIKLTNNRIRALRAKAKRGKLSKADEKKLEDAEAELVKLRTSHSELQQEIADNLREQFEKQREMWEKETAKATAEGTTNFAGRRLNLSEALNRAQSAGTGQDVTRITGEIQKDQQRRFAELQRRISQANSYGYTELAETLGEQLETLWGEMQDTTETVMQRGIEQINEVAQRDLGRIERRGRFADRLAAFDPVAAAQERERLSGMRGGVLGVQRAGLVATLGGEGAYQRLRDTPLDRLTQTQISLIESIETLDEDIADAAAETRELKNATQQLVISRINEKAQFGTGVTGTLANIVNKIGAAAGSVDTEALKKIYEQTATFLAAQGTDLRREFTDITRIALENDPAALVTQMQGVLTNWETITAGMTETEQATLRDLVTSILGNTEATLDNSEATRALTAANTQTFTSAAWRAFRQAIFTGSGGLITEYAGTIPQLQTGGLITRGGVFELHAGEFVVNPDRSNLPLSEGDVNVNVHMVREKADPMEIAQRAMWVRRTAGRR